MPQIRVEFADPTSPPPIQKALPARETKNPGNWRIIAAIAFLLVGSVFIFARLGHYALWDDEAQTAILAKSVWASGDTSAMVGHNLLAFRAGQHLRNLHDRFNAPLTIYLTAPFVAIGPTSAWFARLPAAICGMLTIALIVRWLWRLKLDAATWAIVFVALFSNVSLFLFCRQARYSSESILLTVALIYLFVNHNGSRKWLIIFGFCAAALLGSSYLNYAPLMACFAIDFLFWRRKTLQLKFADYLAVILPQLIAVPLVIIWNPLRTEVTKGYFSHTLKGKFILLWWYLRDLNGCEFYVAGLMIGAIAVAIFCRRRVWLVRGLIFIAAYIFLLAMISQQNMNETAVADVRYAAPLIPVLIGVQVLAICVAVPSGRWRWGAIPIALLTFSTNLFHFTWLHAVADDILPPWSARVHSTVVLYARELADPPPEPYTPTADWLRANAPKNATVWVQPDYMAYPLMFHAPDQIYAWQLKDPPENVQFANLSDIFFIGRTPPDYLITFGPWRQTLAAAPFRVPVRYEIAAQLPYLWRDMYRPELFWRQFEPIPITQPELQEIYIYRHLPDPKAEQKVDPNFHL